MSIRKNSKKVFLSGPYVDNNEYDALVDKNGALKTVILNYKPGRLFAMKGFRFTAEPAWSPDVPRKTDFDWTLEYGIDLLGGQFSALRAADGDKVDMSLLIPMPDGTVAERYVVEDIYLYQGSEYVMDNPASVACEPGWTLRFSYTNTEPVPKEIFFCYKLFR